MEVSIYVNNLIWKNLWYNVIIDVDWETEFDTVEDFVDYMIETERVWQKIYKHFNP